MKKLLTITLILFSIISFGQKPKSQLLCDNHYLMIHSTMYGYEYSCANCDYGIESPKYNQNQVEYEVKDTFIYYFNVVHNVRQGTELYESVKILREEDLQNHPDYYAKKELIIQTYIFYSDLDGIKKVYLDKYRREIN